MNEREMFEIRRHIAMRRGKSVYEALAAAAMEAREREEREKWAITGAWVDELAGDPECDSDGA